MLYFCHAAHASLIHSLVIFWSPQHASLEEVPVGPAADACILGLLLPPSDSALVATAYVRCVAMHVMWCGQDCNERGDKTSHL